MIRYSLAHVPTWLLLIGWPLFWMEMYLRPSAQTSPLAWADWGIVVFITWYRSKGQPSLQSTPSSSSLLLKSGIAMSFILLLLSFFASTLPPHLGQEGDVLNYHYSIPRQHLIRGSFEHLAWSSIDLWLLPIQYALAPFWFSTPLPNKLPQWIFLVGLLCVLMRLVWLRSGSKQAAAWCVIAVMGSHAFGIQFGTAMLDIVIVYLALAAWDSFSNQRWVMGSIELTFWFWSKPFMPIQGVLLIIFLLAVLSMTRRWTVSGAWPDRLEWRRIGISFAIASLVIAGPFLFKSFGIAGTPLYPFMPKEAFRSNAQAAHTVKDAYGEGRTVTAFIRHWWTIAVPDKGVNNKFDYPAGLPYLLCLLPFFYLLARSLQNRHRDDVLLFPMGLWALWWVTSQQTRWLYLPFILMFMAVLTDIRFRENRWLQRGLILAILINTLSVTRAHWADLKKWPDPTLRDWDQFLLTQTRGKPSDEEITVSNKEIAFAEAPVRVTGPDHFYILETRQP